MSDSEWRIETTGFQKPLGTRVAFVSGGFDTWRTNAAPTQHRNIFERENLCHAIVVK